MFVKICGTTTEEDALLAVALGADALGFIFAPSKRQVAPGAVADIVKRLPPEILTVGVFRDEAPQRVVDIVVGCGLHAAQLHGHETPTQTRWVRERVRAVIKGFPAGSSQVLEAAEHGADVVLLDGIAPGSGKVFDWALAGAVPAGSRLLLAGGLTPENVGDAIAAVRPWGVDVASGVEARAGHKDPVKLRAFIANAKAATKARPTAPTAARRRQGPYDWQEDQQ